MGRVIASLFQLLCALVGFFFLWLAFASNVDAIDYHNSPICSPQTQNDCRQQTQLATTQTILVDQPAWWNLYSPSTTIVFADGERASFLTSAVNFDMIVASDPIPGGLMSVEVYTNSTVSKYSHLQKRITAVEIGDKWYPTQAIATKHWNALLIGLGFLALVALIGWIGRKRKPQSSIKEEIAKAEASAVLPATSLPASQALLNLGADSTQGVVLRPSWTAYRRSFGGLIGLLVFGGIGLAAGLARIQSPQARWAVVFLSGLILLLIFGYLALYIRNFRLLAGQGQFSVVSALNQKRTWPLSDIARILSVTRIQTTRYGSVTYPAYYFISQNGKFLAQINTRLFGTERAQAFVNHVGAKIEAREGVMTLGQLTKEFPHAFGFWARHALLTGLAASLVTIVIIFVVVFAVASPTTPPTQPIPTPSLLAIPDPCVLGSWTLVSSTVSSTKPALHLSGLSGTLLTVSADGGGTLNFDSSQPLLGTSNGQSVSSLYRGTLSAHVHVLDHSLFSIQSTPATATITTTLAGVLQPVLPLTWDQSLPYTCSATQLHLSAAGGGVTEDDLYRRTS